MSSKNIVMAAAGASGKPTYWISTVRNNITNITATDEFWGVKVDSQGNSYTIGRTGVSIGGWDFALIKFNKFGDIVWQKSLGGNDSEFGYGIALDYSGNIFITGVTYSTGVAGSGDAFLAKYDSAGTLQWQKILGGTQLDGANSVVCDSSGNAYMLGNTYSSGGSGGSDILLAKYDSAGNLQWQKSLGSSSNEFGNGIGIDSSNNIYIAGSSGSFDIIVAKYNSSGTLQWQKRLGGSNTTRAEGIAVDPSDGNSYVIGSSEASGGAGGFDVIIARYGNDGTLQWQRSLGSSSFENGRDIAVNSLGVFIVGTTYATPKLNQGLLVAKYSKLGVLEWQRIFDRPGVTSAGNGIAVSKDSVYIVGASDVWLSSGYYNAFIAKLPIDGTFADKEYGDYRYISSTFTDTNRFFNDMTSSLTDVTRSLINSTNNLSVKTVTFEANRINIPENYWLSVVNGDYTDIFYDVAVDSEENVYAVGRRDLSGILIKYNSAGVIQWQRRIHKNNLIFAPLKIDIGPLNQIYVIANYQKTANARAGVIIKYDTSGNVVWQRELYNPSDNANYDFTDIVCNKSVNFVYVCGQIGVEPSEGLIVLYDSNGSVLWKKRLSSSETYVQPQAITIATAGDVFTTGRTYKNEYGYSDIFVTRHYGGNAGSAGGLALQTNLQGSNQTNYLQSISEDWGFSICLNRSQDRVIIAGKTQGPSTYTEEILVLNLRADNFSYEWARAIGESTGYESAFAVYTDIFDNIYLTGYGGNTTSPDISIVKLDFAPSLVSQIKITHPGQYSEKRGLGIFVDNSNSMYVAGWSESGAASILLKLPTQFEFKTGTWLNSKISGGSLQLETTSLPINSSILLALSSRSLTNSDETLSVEGTSTLSSEPVEAPIELTIIQGE